MMLNYFRLAYTILKNRLGIISYPSFVTYIITWRCNAKCIMCDIWKKAKGYEMGINEIDNIFKQLKTLDAVRITGGEPFLRDDIADIVNVIQTRNNPHIIHITTNGLLKDKMLVFFNRIKNPKNIHIKISINAFAKEHDKIMGFDGAFETALDTLKGLINLKDKYKFFLGVNQTITTKESMQDYEKLKKICSDFNVSLFPVLAYAKTAIYSQEENLELFPKKKGEFKSFAHFSKDDLEDTLKKLLEDARKNENFTERLIKKYYLTGAYNRLILGKAYPSPKCAALKNHLRILPNGDVPICLYNSHIVGNLCRQPFREIWFGPEIEKFRQKIKDCPICWAECEIGPNAAYTGDIVNSILVK
jgi:Fe-coproporphyrin III synthase